MKIPNDGYLVGWQYKVTTYTNPCPTYAAIFQCTETVCYRKTHPVLLNQLRKNTTEYPKQIMTIFISNETFIVDERDVVGIFTLKNVNCTGRFVSSSNNSINPNMRIFTKGFSSLSMEEKNILNDIYTTDIPLDNITTVYQDVPRNLDIKPLISGKFGY